MNYAVFQWINNLVGHLPFLDIGMIFITDSVPYVALILMLGLWFSNAKKETAIAKQHTALYAALSVAMALIFNSIIHLAYYHPRPFVTHHVHQLVPHAADSSFVSDHSVLVFAIAFTMLLRNDTWKNIALVWAILVGISRIYIGVHYPGDILGAAVLSCGTSGLVIRLSNIVEPLAQLLFHIYAKLTKRISFLSRYAHTTHKEK